MSIILEIIISALAFTAKTPSANDLSATSKIEPAVLDCTSFTKKPIFAFAKSMLAGETR